MRRPPDRERGAALLTVLMLVAVSSYGDSGVQFHSMVHSNGVMTSL